MKIAFVRGPFLNPWELQTYLPLTQRHDFVAVGADWQFYDRPIPGLGWPVEKPHLWAAASVRWSPRLPVLLNRARSWMCGESYGLTSLERVVRGCDILHPAETYTTMTYQCLQLRKRLGCRVVATVWENLPHLGELHPRRRARKREVLRSLDGFLAVTETSRRMLIADGAPEDRIDVIPMAVDLTHFRPGPKDPAWMNRWGLKSNEKLVLFIGRWVEEKGIREIVAAIPVVLRAVGAPVRFCFVGAGPLEPFLRQAARTHAGSLLLVPFVSYDQLPALHNMADVFVLASKPAPKWQEQFGYVLVESMACGKAIVTTRSGSIPDVVGETAVLIPPADASALASALVRLLTSDLERGRLGELARQRAQEQFDATTNARRIEAFYERALSRPL